MQSVSSCAFNTFKDLQDDAAEQLKYAAQVRPSVLMFTTVWQLLSSNIELTTPDVQKVLHASTTRISCIPGQGADSCSMWPTYVDVNLYNSKSPQAWLSLNTPFSMARRAKLALVRKPMTLCCS